MANIPKYSKEHLAGLERMAQYNLLSPSIAYLALMCVKSIKVDNSIASKKHVTLKVIKNSR